jgi:hypothetical protein
VDVVPAASVALAWLVAFKINLTFDVGAAPLLRVAIQGAGHPTDACDVELVFAWVAKFKLFHFFLFI